MEDLTALFDDDEEAPKKEVQQSSTAQAPPPRTNIASSAAKRISDKIADDILRFLQFKGVPREKLSSIGIAFRNKQLVSFPFISPLEAEHILFTAKL